MYVCVCMVGYSFSCVYSYRRLHAKCLEDKLEGVVLVPLQVRSEGFLALWKGFLPTWSRMVSESLKAGY